MGSPRTAAAATSVSRLPSSTFQPQRRPIRSRGGRPSASLAVVMTAVAPRAAATSSARAFAPASCPPRLVVELVRVGYRRRRLARIRMQGGPALRFFLVQLLVLLQPGPRLRPGHLLPPPVVVVVHVIRVEHAGGDGVGLVGGPDQVAG